MQNRSKSFFKMLLPGAVLALMPMALLADAPRNGLADAPARQPVNFRSEVVQKAGAQAGSLSATATGVRIQCPLQAIDAEVMATGLKISSTSTSEGLGCFSLRPLTVGRTGQAALAVPAAGRVSSVNGLARLDRGSMTEEFSVSPNGIRQDFVIPVRPAGRDNLILTLAAEAAAFSGAGDAVELRMDNGRKLTYNSLKVTDATGRLLKARMATVASRRLAITVDDRNATYPVRIDPVITDADWYTVGSGFTGISKVYALAFDSNGYLYAGGDFLTAGGVAANHIAKWDGSAWSPLGSGMNAYVKTIVCDSSGNVYVGGAFFTAGGVSAERVAKWDGTNWSGLGTGLPGYFSYVFSLKFDAAGNLYAGGWFSSAGANNIAKWDGTSWSAIGDTSGPVYALAFDSTGTKLYVGGQFTVAGGIISNMNHVAMLDTTTGVWSSVGTGLPGYTVFSLLVDRNDDFIWAGGRLDNGNIAQWSKSTGSWAPMPGGGINGDVMALAQDATGLVYAGGEFTMAGGVTYGRVVRTDGNTWYDLGSGVAGTWVAALAIDSTGSLYVGGYFTSAGGKAAYSIARCQVTPPAITFSPDTWSVGAKGGTQSETINSVGAWYASSDQAWLTVNGGLSASGTGFGGVVLAAPRNTTGAARTANVRYSLSQVVSVTKAKNTAPVASAQSPTTDEDTAAAITLSATDVDSDSLTYSVVAVPTHGALTGTAPNLTYTPTANYNGPDSFTFKANDGLADSTVATVSITVTAVNDAPVALAQSPTTAEDTAKAITLSSTDAETNPRTYSVVAGPSHGALSGTAPNLTYTPVANYNGLDSFTFKANDGTADSNVATVSITVTAVNDAPVAAAQSPTTAEDTATAITLSATDVESSPLTYSVVAGPSHGALSGTAPNLTYTPVADYNGPDSFTFKANDGTADSNVATVSITVTPVQDAPVAADQSPTTAEDTAKAITLSATDVDLLDTLTYSVVAGPSHGALSGTIPNLTYTPVADYNGPDSFTFKVNDGTVDSNTATVSITVTAVNDAPRITLPNADVTVATGAEADSFNQTVTASDIEGDPMTYAWDYSIDGGGSWIAIAGQTTAALTFAIPYDIAPAGTSLSGGKFQVRATVSDGAAASSRIWTVTQVNDTAGFALLQADGTTALDPRTLNVLENGTTTFKAKLTAKPRAGQVVVLKVASSAILEATVSPATLTFDETNWTVPQTVTVSGVNDLTGGNDTATVTVAVDVAAVNRDIAWDGVASQDVAVTCINDVSFIVSKTAMTLDEAGAGSTGTFTVVLSARPAANVVLNLTSSSPADATVVNDLDGKNVLEFTMGNWNIPQTVRVAAVDDEVVRNDSAIITVSTDNLNSDDEWDNQSKTVAITCANDDSPQFTLSKTTATVNESGTVTDTFTVVLNKAPATPVTLSVTSLSPAEATVSPATLTFNLTNWNVAQTVTVTGVPDNTLAVDTATVRMAIDPATSNADWIGLAAQDVTVTCTNDDVAGFTLSKSAVTVAENGGTGTFTVKLTAQPVADVELSVVSDNTADATVAPATLTFSSANWNVGQTVTVTGINDDTLGNGSATVTVAVNPANSDDAWDLVAAQAVAVTCTNDDSAGFTLSTSTLTVAENAGTNTFTVKLTAKPAATVKLTVVSGSPGDATVSPATLTFDPADWNTPQTVTVTGVNDNYPGDDTAIVTVAVDTPNSDVAWALVANKTVTVTCTNDDAAGFSVTPTAVTVAEAGGPATFDVQLTAQPANDVTFTVVSSSTAEATVNKATLTFTNLNWNVPQTVTVTGVNDNHLGNDSATVTVAVDAANSDNGWGAVANQTVAVTCTNDDAAGFSVSPGTATVAENNGTATFDVQLTSQPASDVVFTVGSSSIADATVDKATLTFTAANWNVVQTVTITGVNDDHLGNDSATVTVAVDAANSDDAWDVLTSQTVAVTCTNDDSAGFSVSKTAVTVNESGTTTATFDVALTAQPASDVILQVASSALAVATVDKSTLTFTSANWNTAQTVTVTGVEDLVATIRTATVSVSVQALGSDDNWDLLAAKTVDVTCTDNDASFTVTGLPATINENASTTFTVVLDRQPGTNVVLNVASGNTAEATVSPATLTFTPADWNTPQTVTVQSVNDDWMSNDSADISVTVDAATSDDAWDALSAKTGTVTFNNTDSPSFTVTPLTLTIGENGGADIFTVVLDKKPVGKVTIGITSLLEGEALVSSDGTTFAKEVSLTFTAADWNVPKTVSAQGVDDVMVDAHSTLVAVWVDDLLSDAPWGPLPVQMVDVFCTNDDLPGFTLSKTTAAVNESGMTDTFTVVLKAQPASDVVMQVASSDPATATVDKPTLTFTTANWNAPQTVTVTGVEDAVAIIRTATVTVSVDAANSNDYWDSLASQMVLVTCGDNDASFSITGSPATVNENGTTTFTVVLDKQPAGDVNLKVSSSSTADVTVSPETLAFTTVNWNTPQTVTITGVNDDHLGNDLATVTVSVDDAASDDAWDPLADQTVPVTCVNDDSAGFILSKATAAVSETGTTDSFTVVLTAQPASNVVMTVGSSDVGEATVDQATLTFTPANWGAPQTVTVTGVDDNVVDGTLASTVTVAVDAANSDDAWDALAAKTVAVETADDDVADFVLSETAVSVAENNGTKTFTAELKAQPAGNVVLTVTSSSPADATVSPATLTFTPASWNVPQTVTITGVNDDHPGNDLVAVTVAVDDANSNDEWDGLADQTVAVTCTNDDFAGFTLSKTAVTVAENGGTDTFTVKLTAQPATNVVLDVASSSTADATVSSSTLTFTSADWNTPQTVTITGVNDDHLGNDSATVTVSVNDDNSDNDWDPLANQTVAVTCTNDDSAGFTLSKTTAAVDESGTTDSFTVVLNAQPASNVVLAVGSSDLTEATVAPALLTFTSANWNTPQTVTVTGVDDFIIDGTPTSTVTVTVDDSSLDDAWDAMADQTVAVTTTDNDAAGFTLSKTTATVSETGTTNAFTVVLTAKPASNVVLTVGSSDIGEATVAPALLTFTPGDWNTPQTVTLTGVDDSIIDGTQTSTVTVAVDPANSDDAWDALAAKTVAVDTTDDDSAGVSLSKTTATVAENGGTDTFTVKLAAKPAANVVLTVVSSSTADATVSPATLTFTTDDWDTPQPVTITGVNDNHLGDDSATVTMAVDTANSDAAWAAMTPGTVAVTCTDDDVAGFTLSKTAATVAENGGTDTFTVRLTAQPASNVVFSVTSDSTGNATVLPATLTFTPAAWNVPQTVTVTGVNDSALGNHSATVSVSVQDINSDNDWGSLADQTVAVTCIDDDSTLTVTPVSVLLPTPSGDRFQAVTVTSNTTWSVTSNQSWLTPSVLTGTIGETAVTLTAAVNPTVTDRTATATFAVAGKTVVVTVTQAAGLPSLTLTPSSWMPPAIENLTTPAKELTTTVNIGANYKWKASSNVSWLTITSPLPPVEGGSILGITNTSISLAVDPNPFAWARVGKITVGALDSGNTVVNTKEISVIQAAAQPAFTVKDSLDTEISSLTLEATAGSKSFKIKSNAIWTIRVDPATPITWLSAISPASGRLDGTVSISVLVNTTLAARSVNLQIVSGGTVYKTIAVTQTAGTLTVTPLTWAPIGTSSSQRQISVTSPEADWTATSDQSWLTVSPAGGIKSGLAASLTLTAAINPTVSSRPATVKVVAGGIEKIISVTQSAGNITVSASVASLTFNSAAGSTGTVKVTSNAAWSVTQIPTWLTATPNTGPAGETTVTLLATATATQRPPDTVKFMSGTAWVTVAVTQVAPTTVAVSLNPAGNVAAAGGTPSMLIAISPAQTWTATSDKTWLRLARTSSVGLVTSDAVVLTVDPNPDLETSRMATVTLVAAGLTRTMTVTQLGTVAYLQQTAPPALPVVRDWVKPTIPTLDSSIEGTDSISFATNLPADDIIAEASNVVPTAWFDVGPVTVNAGIGSVSLNYFANGNPPAPERTATVTIRRRSNLTDPNTTVTISVKQDKFDAMVVSPTSVSLTKEGTGVSVEVTSPLVSWTVIKSDAWIVVDGFSAGGFVISATPNGTVSTRSGSVVVKTTDISSPQTITIPVTQAATVIDALKLNNSLSNLSLSLTSSASTLVSNPVTVAIDSNVSWTATSSQSWVTLSSASGTAGTSTVNILVDANSSLSARSATVTVTTTGSSPRTMTITVNQAALASGIVPTLASTVKIGPSGGTYAIVVTGRVDGAGVVERGISCLVGASERTIKVPGTTGSFSGRISGLGNGDYNVRIYAKDDKGIYYYSNSKLVTISGL
jgi:hypothetical protein